jgi:DNA-binding response OmpR family regulator
LLVREAVQRDNLALEVHVVADGQQAIDCFARAEVDPSALAPDILLLDLNLPKMDGFEVLRRVRASDKFKHIPVLIVTSSDSPEDRAEAATLGAGYFRKPTGYEEYLKIASVLKQFLEEGN